MVHLYRGAPAVRSWSKYQHTIDDWTLCGIKRKLRGLGRGVTECTEEAGAVSCPFCLLVMQSSPSVHAKKRHSTEAA